MSIPLAWLVTLSCLAAFAITATPAASADAAATPAPEPAVRLLVRDGQLASHIFVVMVKDLVVNETMQPKLRLAGPHWVHDPLPIEQQAIDPIIVAPRQTRTMTIDGQQVSVEGTLMMFNLRKYSLHLYESAVRLLPRVEWTVPASTAGQPPTKRVAVAEQEIYLGNMPGAALWTALIMLLITAALFLWSDATSKEVTKFKPTPALLLITGHDGYLSLWRTQLMLWTYAIGSLVFLFGLVRLKVPEIPDSLVALMGMSLLTGFGAKVGSGANPPASAQPAAGTDGNVPAEPAQTTTPAQTTAPPQSTAQNQAPRFNPDRARWSDLVSTWNSVTGQVELSVPKAQMVLWTVLIVTLFCVKSVLEGVLWDVPWQMVALTGFSQAGYVGDKFVKSKS